MESKNWTKSKTGKKSIKKIVFTLLLFVLFWFFFINPILRSSDWFAFILLDKNLFWIKWNINPAINSPININKVKIDELLKSKKRLIK